jgi:hypothetical protein
MLGEIPCVRASIRSEASLCIPCHPTDADGSFLAGPNILPVLSLPEVRRDARCRMSAASWPDTSLLESVRHGILFDVEADLGLGR